VVGAIKIKFIKTISKKKSKKWKLGKTKTGRVRKKELK